MRLLKTRICTGEQSISSIAPALYSPIRLSPGIMIQKTEPKWAAWQNQKITCAPSKDSDQPGHQPSLIRVFAVRMKKHWALITTYWAHSEDSDQTGRMPRLIWVFAGRTYHFVGFVMRRLKLQVQSYMWFIFSTEGVTDSNKGGSIIFSKNQFKLNFGKYFEQILNWFIGLGINTQSTL